MSIPVVNILHKHWGDLEPHERNYKVHPEWQDGQTDEYEDVGWMYLHTYDYVGIFDQFAGFITWDRCYVRPPFIVDEDESRYPGLWRRGKVGRGSLEDS